MKQHEAEDLYIRSLDATLGADEAAVLAEAFRANPGLGDEVSVYLKIREKLAAKEQATFGPFFAARVVHVITQSRAVFDHYLFSLFRKFQLAAAGILIGLLALNVVFAEQPDIISVLGFDNTSGSEGAYITFDFFESIDESL
jgi:hypothetical protein